MLAKPCRCYCGYHLGFLFTWLLIVGLLGFVPQIQQNCFAANFRILAQESESDELSEEEAKSIKIADRFFSILEKSPRRGTALERVYGHHVEFGTLDEFLSGLKNRVKDNPEDGTGWMLLGMFEAHRGQDAEAVDAFFKAEKFLTEDALASYYLGQSQLLIGQPEKAVEAFERAIDRKPRRPDMLEIFRQLGRVHQRAQRTEEALKVWDRLEKLFPDDARVQEQIAITMVEEGEYGLALPRYENLATIVRDDYRRVTFLIEVAELKIRLNNRKQGIADLENLLADLNPTGWLFRDVRRRIEDIFLRSGDQDGLVAYYENWIDKNPEDVGAIARLARFLASSARVEEASQWMEKALTLAPKRTDLRKSFIDQLVNEQRYAEASRQYARLVKSSPGNPDFLRDWGKLVMKDRSIEKSKRREQAVKIWSRIIEARPNDALTQAQVADLFRQSGLEAEAIQRYEKAIELAPGEPQYREYLGEYFHILKRSDDALKIWESIAEGKRNTAGNVARLAEVYNSFGYLPQAVEKIATACELEPKEFTYQLKAAEYHMRLEKFDEALAFNTAANSVLASEEETELVLKNRIEIFQTSRKLDDEIDRLRAEVESAAEPTVDAWHTLARYLEASRNWADATEALEKALAINDKSISVLTSSARIAETSGNFARAAAENRKLAVIDRRLRSDHLMNVARLEAQLGNRDNALEAAKELIVSAPGNTDNYLFYSQMCYRLGEAEMGLDALRKAVRINPTEPALTIALGRALADEFRTDEAIEVYWRAFEKTDEIDDQTSLVQKLTPLYEQQNQFDKLLERLERDRREESRRREMTICLAQAHNTAGDYGTARRELESLLTDNTRDTNLLQQLSKLCESGSDLDAAVAYQTQLAKISPGHEAEFRLAKLLFSNGKRDAASEIFVKLTAREENPVRLLKSIDSLLKRSDYDSVVKVTEPLVSESRDNWELLYREGVALAKQEKIDVAKLRFERILTLNFPHDKMGVSAEQRFKRATQKSKSNNNQGIRSKIPEQKSAFQLAQQETDSAKRATGMSEQHYYGSNQLPPVWTPSHFGIARMAAYAWLMRFESNAEVEKDVVDRVDNDADPDEFEENEKEVASFTDAIVEKGKQENADLNQILDWFYVESLNENYKEIFTIARTLAVEGGKPEMEFFLSSLAMRAIDPKNAARNSQQNVPDPEPLSESDIELMLKCYEATSKEDDAFGSALGSGQVLFSGGRLYVRVGNSWRTVSQGGGSLAQVTKELKLAGKTELAQKMIKDKIDAARKPGQLVQAMLMMLSEKKLDRIDEFLAKWKSVAQEEIELAPMKVSSRGKSSNKHSANQTALILDLILKWTGPLAAEEENAKVLAIINDALDVEMKERIKKRKQAQASRRKRSSQRQYHNSRIPYQYGDQQSTANVEYPRSGDYLSTTGIHLLRQGFEVVKKNEVEDDLTTLIRERVEKAKSESPESLIFEQMLLATLQYWQEEKDDAIETFRAVSEQIKDDQQFQFEVAELYEKLGDHDEALNIIEAIEPRQQKLVQRKETKALELAERLGDHDRAREAAERLFGLRLKSQTQLSLIDKLKRLGMVEMADAIISRAQRRGGQKIPAMVSLMGLYQGQGKTDLATQVAHRILQRTRSSVSQAALVNRSRRYSRRNSDESHRNSAISTLQQTGNLTAVIERLEKQRQRSPDSPAIYEQLIEFYLHTNDTEKLIPILETAVQSRPKSTYFREQLAKQYSTQGKHEEACQQYVAAIRANPMMLSDDYYSIKGFFDAANRTNDLLKVFEEINIRDFGQPYYIADFASELLRRTQAANIENMSEEKKKANEVTELAALRLAEKIFEEYPDYRRYVIQNFNGTEVWKNKRLFSLARRSIIPTKSQAKSDPWYGLNDISSYQGDGSVHSMFHDIFEGIEGTDQEQELCSSIEKNIKLKPQWHAGKIMLAMFDVRGDKEDKAKDSLAELFADDKLVETLNGNSAWLVAQELEKFSETRQIAVSLLEKVVKRQGQDDNDSIQHSAKGKLISLYVNVKEKEKARKLLLDAAKQKTHEQYDQQYQMYQRGEKTIWITEKLLELECPADAVATIQDMISDQAMLQTWTNYGGRSVEHANQIYTKALQRTLASDDRTGVAEKILAVRENPRAGEGAFDLQVGIRPNTERQKRHYTLVNGNHVPVYADDPQNNESQVECKMFGLLEALSGKEIGKELVGKRLSELRSEKPTDKTVAIADTWFQLNQTPDDVASVESLLKLVTQNPLDEIKEGRRPNSRQRREAMQHVALWPISYRCLASKEEQIREVGKKLGEIAIGGARLQTDKQYQNRMLFEWGTMAAKDDNLQEAEQKWSQLLDEVTRRPTRKKKPRPSGAAPPVPRRLRVPGTGMLDRSGLRAAGSIAELQGKSSTGRQYRVSFPLGYDDLAIQAIIAPWSAATMLQAPTVTMPRQEKSEEKTEAKAPILIAPLTNSQFQTALQVAAAAADNGMIELSKRAMREMLKGGLPVADPEFEDSSLSNPGGMIYIQSSGSPTSTPSNATTASEFGSQVADILDAWKTAKGYDPVEVYEMVVGEIFPENRPQEILLYEDSSNIGNGSTSSLARKVVSWAAIADRLDDFKQRIASRESQRPAEVQANVLKGMVALEEEDFAAVQDVLTKFVDRLGDRPVKREILLACHVAVPAWSADESLRGQCIEIYRKKLASDEKPDLGVISTRVNRHLATNGGEAEVRKFIEGYLSAQQAQYSNYGGDYGIYQMQRALFRVSGDLAESNLTDLALHYLGRGQDLKHSRNYGGRSQSNQWAAIANRIRALSPEERYEKLKEWTLPKQDRQTVRFSSAWSADSGDELADFRAPENRETPDASIPGLQNSFLDLIDAAVEAGKLDDLKNAVASVDKKAHPEIEGLHLGVAIRANDPTAKELVKKYVEQSDKRGKHTESLKRTTNNWIELLVYRLCLQHSEEMAMLFDNHRWKIIKANVGGSASSTRREYEKLRSQSLQASIEPGESTPLTHWNSGRKEMHSKGGAGSWIISDQNQLTSLGGEDQPHYWLRYPLMGNFRFSCEALATGNNYSEIAFGGTRVESKSINGLSFISVSAPGGHDLLERPTNISPKTGRYNQLTIEVEDGVMKKLVNGKILYQEKLTQTYPWLTLFTNSTGLRAWRNPVFEGQPVVPSEIELVAGDRMEGWATTGSESQIAFRNLAQPKPKTDSQAKAKEKKPQEYDWHAKDGVLYGKANPDAKPRSDSFAIYGRPMVAGERLTYEFRYQPGKQMANPILGSVIVGLTEGDNVQELYKGDAELEEFPNIVNVVKSPHAVEPVKLIAGDWNAVELRISDTDAEVVVNDAIVWRRPLAKLDDLLPGVQKFKTQSTEIRNLRLTGNWPEKLPESLGQDAFASQQSLEDKDRQLIAESIGDRLKSVEMLEFYEENNLSDLERYQQLRDWVLPGPGHEIRLDFRTNTKELRTSKQLASELAGDDQTKINCPAWDMVVAAKAVGKTEQLKKAIDSIKLPADKPGNNFISVAGLKALVAIADEDDQTARTHLGEIYSMVKAREAEAKKSKDKVDETTRQLAQRAQNSNASSRIFAQTGINRSLLTAPTWFATQRDELLSCAYDLQSKTSKGDSILARIEKRSDLAVNASAPSALTQWTASPIGFQSINSTGGYLDQWRMASTGVLERMPGQICTPLYFQSPLKGKFEITADVSRNNGTKCWLDYGGYSIIASDKQHSTRIAGASRSKKLKPKKKVPRLQSVVRHRIAVDGNVVETYVNDVRVSRHEFDEAPQPWFTLQSEKNNSRTIVQNIRVTGQPEIPKEIDLLAADRPQWLGSLQRGEQEPAENYTRYYAGGHSPFSQVYIQQSQLNRTWYIKNGELTSGSLTEESVASTSFQPSWIFYKRPMLEDGEFEFEMFADKKTKKLCHVSLGQTALLLKEDGVWRHEIPANQNAEEVADKKVADSKVVQLNDGDWNRVLLRLEGDDATLLVNDQEVAKVAITDAASMRFPGLFRFSDQSNAKVRNVKYRGDWPAELPSIEEQELALSSTQPLAGSVTGPNTEFDFSKSIDDLKNAGLEISDESATEATAEGLKITARGDKCPVASMAVESNRDFDLSVDFADLRIAKAAKGDCSFDLKVNFEDPEKSAISIGIRRNKDDKLYVLAQYQYDRPDQRRGYRKVELFEPFESGTLRLVRRGGKVFAIAGAAGETQRIVTRYTVAGKETKQFSARAKSAKRPAELDCVVKKLSLTMAQQ